MPRSVSPFVILSAALALTGCAATEDLLSEMDGAVDARLANASTTGGVTTSPVPLDRLDQAVKAAVERNDRYASARAQAREAMAGIDVAASGARPQVNASSLGGRIIEGSPSNRTISGAAADLMLTQLVYDGGATRAAINEATARALAARAAALDTGNGVALDAYKAWVRLWSVQQRAALLSSRSEDVRIITDQLERMTQSGMTDSTLLQGARLADIEARSEDARLKSDLAAAEVEFARFFGTTPASLSRPVALLDDAAFAKATKDWQASPRLRRAAAELVAAEAAANGARAARKPTVNLSAGVASPMDQGDTTDATVGFQLRYTLGDGGRRKARIAAAEARQAALEAELAEAQSAAHALLDGAMARLASLKAAAGLIEERVAAADMQAATAEAQIVLGQTTPRQLLDAKIASYRANEERIRLVEERLILEAEIAAGTGALLPRLGLE